jgi:alkyldihydroxyacetonephosphate synthase
VQPADLEAIRRDLAAIVGAKNVSVRPSERLLYSRDCWPRTLLWQRDGEPRYAPDVVVWPSKTDDVARIIRYGRTQHLPITPFGGGTGTVGGAIAMRAGITMDLKRLRRIPTVDLSARTAVAQAGVVGERLEEALQRRGATLGHFPDSMYASTLGGWIATRSAGQLATHFGKIEDMVLGLTAVAGTGEVIRTGPERNPGPDLMQLLAGSEGTLAVVTEATLAIHRKPTARVVRAFRVRTLTAGLEIMRQIMRMGLRPQVLRLFETLDSLLAGEQSDVPEVTASPTISSVVSAWRSQAAGAALTFPSVLNRAVDLLPPRSILVAAFEGESKGQLESELQATVDLVRDAGGADLGEGPALRWYQRRFAPGYRQSAVFGGRAWMDTFEVAATWDKIADAIDAVRRAVANDALVTCHIGHVYLEGCAVTFTFAGPALSVAKGELSLEQTWRKALSAAHAAGATISHHTGVGAARARSLPSELGDSGMQALRSLKSAFDPDGILNPGKLFS